MIDILDQQILEALTSNARTPFKDIAEQCGVSRAAIHQRVEKLFQRGVIANAGFQVNPQSLGYDTCTFIGVNFTEASKAEAVEEAMKAIPEVVECHNTTGAYGLLLRVYCRNNADLARILSIMSKIDGLSRTETLISLCMNFQRPLPLDLCEPSETRRRRTPKAMPDDNIDC